jgi:hypothetical protein
VAQGANMSYHLLGFLTHSVFELCQVIVTWFVPVCHVVYYVSESSPFGHMKVVMCGSECVPPGLEAKECACQC